MKTAQSVMLAITGKKTESVDLTGPLLSYVRSNYSDREADEAADDITMVQQLRTEIATAYTGGNSSLKDSHAKYLRCLTAIETRFPISKEKGNAQITFSWYDAFQPKKKASQCNIHFEKAAVMFNFAAIVSQMALVNDRATGDGLKQACQMFQEASGLFGYMRENEINKVDSPRPTDMSTECVTLLEKLMLVQAQECVYHKGSIDKKSPAVLAKLAKQTAVMYSEVERLFGGAALEKHLDKSWLAHAQMKASVYDVECLVQYGRAFNAEEKISHEIAVLQEAFKRVQGTKKFAKAVSAEMLESVNKMQESIQFSLSKAEKDNGTIFLQRVPPFLDLPPLQGALLVKSVTPSSLESGGQESLLNGLIPESSAKAMSKYSEMVDSTTRDLQDKLAAATDNARIKLMELELPAMIDALDVRTSAALPSALQHELEEVESVGGKQHLQEILVEIGQLRESLDQDLFQVQAELDNDAQLDASARTKYGDQWRLMPAATVAKPYWDKIAVFRSSLQRATDSDKSVMARLQGCEQELSNLTIDSALTKMPRLQAPMVNTGPDDPAVVVANLRRNLEVLQTLAGERAAMEEAIKEMKKKDNITPKLMATAPQGHDALFASEIRKYSGLHDDVSQNLAHQDKVMFEVERDAKIFRQVFDVAGWHAACEASSQGIRESIKTFRELLDHLSEGLRFYIGTSDVVRKCLQEAQDFVYTRGVQREELKQDLDKRKQMEESDRLARQMAQASMHPGSGAPAAYPAPPSASSSGYQQAAHGPGAPYYPQQGSMQPAPPPPAAAAAPPPPPSSPGHLPPPPPPPLHYPHAGPPSNPPPAYYQNQQPAYYAPQYGQPQYSQPSQPYSQPPPYQPAGYAPQQQYGAPPQQYQPYGQAPQPYQGPYYGQQ